jgi:two-component system sensor histidine kinase/response regulator
MAFFAIRELSLRQRLLLLTMVTSGIGVVFGCFSFLFYDSHAARQQKVEELQSTADLIDTNSTAALVFGDASGGSKLLEAVFQALGVRPPPEKEPSIRVEAGSRRALQLLLAEDNRVNQKLALRLLEKMGHHVVLAVNGEEAIEMLRLRPFDLVLMDIQMPVLGGVEATRKIRKEEQSSGAHTPIIAMTAHAMAGDAEKYLLSGMDGYVSKPIQVDLLRAEIERLTNNGRPRVDQRAKKAEKALSSLIFDHAELLARVENDRELLRDLLAIFKEEFPRQLLALREAVEAGDGDRVATAAHTLSGMLSNLSATEAAATAARLEQMGRKKETLGFQEAFGRFENDANRLLPQLDACLTEVCK